MNESRRIKRLMVGNYRLATKLAVSKDTMSVEALKSIVRHQVRDIVDENLLTNDDVIAHAVLIMTRQN